MTKKILVLGGVASHYILQVDHIPDDDTTIYITNPAFDTLFLGGTGCNIAYSLGKLGDNEISIMSSTDKKYGQVAIDGLNSVGVNTDHVPTADAKGTAWIIEDQDKRRLTILGGDGTIPNVPIPEGFFENYDLMIFSVDSKGNVDEYIDYIEKHDFKDFAFSMRSDRTIFTDDFLRKCCPRAKLIFCNEFERTLIEKALGVKNITELFDIGRAEVICITQGAKGSIIYQKTCKGDGVQISATTPNMIEDCTGAGDGFVAGFVYGYSQGMKPIECAKLGATLSSFIIEKIGCTTNSPTREELFERYYQRKDVERI